MLEATARHVGEQLVAVAKMAIGRGRRTPARRSIGECESGRPLLGDQLKRGAYQGFLEVAVVIAALARSVAKYLARSWPGP